MLWGVFAGLLLLACVSPALTHLHVESYWEKAIQGMIILLAVVADGIRTKRGNSMNKPLLLKLLKHEAILL